MQLVDIFIAYIHSMYDFNLIMAEMSGFTDESLTCLSLLDSVDIYAKNGAAIETDTSRRDQN